MPRWYKPIGLLLLGSFLWGLAGCSQAADTQQQGASFAAKPPQPASALPQAGSLGEVRSSSGGGVDIDVTWSQAGDGALVFEIAMNTHSVGLDEYDLSALSVLRDDSGAQFYATSWQSPPGGHHRRGTLMFPIPESVTSGETRYIELVISDVAGVKERVLRWDL